MKKIVLMLCLIGILTRVEAQETKEYTDEELNKYASVMVWAEVRKSEMTDIYNGWINNNEDLKAARFVEIKNANGDSVKLEEIEVTDDELVAYQEVITNYDSMTASFKEVYVGKIKDDIGAGLYNTLKKDLKKDKELKARYQEIFSEMKNEAMKEEDESEE